MGIKTLIPGRVMLKVLAILVLTVFLFTSMATPVYAETGPSPLRQAITLRIAAFKLIGIRIENTLLLRAGVEPTPWRLFQLSSEVIQLNAVFDQIHTIMDTSPDDSMVLNALADVRNVAQSIADDINMIIPPDNQRVRELLEQVSSAAQNIADWAYSLLGTQSVGSLRDSSKHSTFKIINYQYIA